MTTSSTLEKPDKTDSGGKDNLDHLYCPCDEDIALCGTDISEADDLENFPEDDLCVVCYHLMGQLCKRCGK